MNTLIKRIRQIPLVIRIRQTPWIKKVRKELFETLKLDGDIDVVDFEDQVVADFRRLMKKNSGRRIIQFPMVFDILLCPQDFEVLEQSIPGSFNEVLADFYGIIKSKRDKTPGSVVNDANNYWQFRFSECPAIEIDGKPDVIPQGKIITTAKLYSNDVLNGSQEGDGQLTNTRQTRTNTRSSLAGKAINYRILRGGIALPNNTFVYSFLPDLPQDLNAVAASQVKTSCALASLTWRSIVSSKKSSHPFMMKESTLNISGAGPKREGEGSVIMIIDVDKVEKDHVQIRYTETDKQFQICAFADGVIANEASIPISKSDSPIWQPLSRESEIIIRDNVSISFNAL